MTSPSGRRAAVLGDVEGEFPDADAPVPVGRPCGRPGRGTIRSGTTRPRTCCTRRCARCWATTCSSAGSLVAPDRLRFDFSHSRPMTADEIREVEELVNGAILDDQDVCVDHLGYDEAIQKGAMALFGEKYGDTVRMISIPGVSMELCGGTHVRHTGEIGLFRIVGETGTGRASGGWRR
jgi:Ser-tRNA(Ala) deacylase AlaX